MSNYSKAAVNERYDALREQLKAGTISQSKFKTAADRLYKLYHSKANKPARNQTAKPQSKVQKAAKAVKDSNSANSEGRPKLYQKNVRYGGSELKTKKAPKQQGDGSVKAIKRKTSFQKEVERRNKIAKGWTDSTGKQDQKWSEENEIQLNKPKKPKLGQMYKNPSTGQIFHWNGSKWVKGKVKITRFKR